MKRNRYMLCLLLAAFMLYFALPKFSIFAQGLEGIFAISWLILALLVIAGNLSALLYAPKGQKLNVGKPKQKRARYLG
ncbi:hypothetical protein [Neobacillus sp. D3-1R]|uniref:hypothetical protein n=1 Tax=Neobacillus sp. D3-1R TaxID=3445778 RepID=UPI003F9F9849